MRWRRGAVGGVVMKRLSVTALLGCMGDTVLYCVVQ